MKNTEDLQDLKTYIILCSIEALQLKGTVICKQIEHQRVGSYLGVETISNQYLRSHKRFLNWKQLLITGQWYNGTKLTGDSAMN